MGCFFPTLPHQLLQGSSGQTNLPCCNFKTSCYKATTPLAPTFTVNLKHDHPFAWISACKLVYRSSFSSWDAAILSSDASDGTVSSHQMTLLEAFEKITRSGLSLVSAISDGNFSCLSRSNKTVQSVAPLSNPKPLTSLLLFPSIILFPAGTNSMDFPETEEPFFLLALCSQWNVTRSAICFRTLSWRHQYLPRLSATGHPVRMCGTVLTVACKYTTYTPSSSSLHLATKAGVTSVPYTPHSA